METINNIFINMNLLNKITLFIVISYISFISLSLIKNLINKIKNNTVKEKEKQKKAKEENYFLLGNTLYQYEKNDLIKVDKNEENEEYSVVLLRKKLKMRFFSGTKEECNVIKKTFYLNYFQKNSKVLF
jgi:hypothetical protein